MNVLIVFLLVAIVVWLFLFSAFLKNVFDGLGEKLDSVKEILEEIRDNRG